MSEPTLICIMGTIATIWNRSKKKKPKKTEKQNP